MNEMRSWASAGKAESGTSTSPVAQVVKENLPARKPRARRFVLESEKRIVIICLPQRPHSPPALYRGYARQRGQRPTIYFSEEMADSQVQHAAPSGSIHFKRSEASDPFAATRGE